MFNIGGTTSGTYGQTKSDSEYQEDRWTKEQQKTAKTLGNYIQPLIGAGSPAYTGQLVAPMSPAESTAQSQLTQWLGAPSPTMGASQDAYMRALTGNYQPIVNDQATTALYNQIRNQIINRDLPELQNTMAKNANLSGMYFSGPHAENQRKLLETTGANLADILAQLRYGDEQTRRDIARERESRQASMIPYAAGMENLPATKAITGLQFGSLPRDIQQSQNTAQYQEFLRTLPENSPILELALAYLGKIGQISGQANRDQTSWDVAQSISGGFGMK